MVETTANDSCWATRSIALPPLLACALLAASPPHPPAANVALCSALHGLRDEARSTGASQRISLFKEAPMSFGCSHGRNRPAERRFCSSTFGAVGPEFTHVFPWRIYDCLRREGIEPRIETSSQYTGLVGRRRIVRLRAGWSDGSRLDIKYEGTGDFGSEPEYRGYYGIYKMVVWLPSKSS